MFHFIFYSLTAQEVDELRLGRERQARKRKAATEKKQAEAKAAEEAAKVKELEEKAWKSSGRNFLHRTKHYLRDF